ncbi:MAG: hypothetical protein L6Q68_02540 [Aquabacterium sp.]|nr:hypothetical protein [Zoogloea sp.]MCK6431899.1 hypothetical protein [Aquabacterium sp.]
MRLRDDPIVTRLVAAAAALAIWLMWALLWPGVAQAQASAPASACPAGIDCGNACGAAATGQRVGTAEPVSLAASEAAGLEVGPDGYWRHCVLVPTPGTACGADGTGVASDGSLRRWARPGWRVDDTGRWAECDRPCLAPAMTPRPKAWTVDGRTCVGDPDRSLAHGQTGYWSQWNGPMRGQYIERCDDGVRRVTGQTCAPAVQCDTAITIYRDGRTYAYNGRRQGTEVPLGGYAQATADDGSTLRVRCDAGRWVAAPQCQPPHQWVQAYTRDRRVYRSDAPVLNPGDRVTLTQVEGSIGPGGQPRTRVMACGTDGRLVPAVGLSPPAPRESRQGDAKAGAASWPGR